MRDKIRFSRLCELLSEADSFADIGCDHGYFCEYMLSNGLCRKVYACDISAACLQKAEKRLKEYIRVGRCVPLVTDGLAGVPEDVSLVLIAGLGGREIVRILQNGFMPKKFVFQPMKNASALREELLSKGARIERDFTFESGGKFYDVIGGEGRGGTDAYSAAERLFGRENVQKRGRDFLAFLDEKIRKSEQVLSRPVSEAERARIEREITLYKGVKNGEIG